MLIGIAIEIVEETAGMCCCHCWREINCKLFPHGEHHSFILTRYRAFHQFIDLHSLKDILINQND